MSIEPNGSVQHFSAPWEASMAQSSNQRVLREVPPVADDNVAIPVQDEAPLSPEAPANDASPREAAQAAAPAKKRSRRPLIFAGVGLIALAAGAWYGSQYFFTGRFMVST